MHRAAQARFSAGIAAGLAATLIWGGQLPIAKGVYAALDGVTLTLVRYASGLVAFPLLLVWHEGKRALCTDVRGWAMAGAAGASLGISVLLLFVGLALTRPEIAVIILALQPALAALAQWAIEKRRPPGFTLGCIAIAFAGVTLVVSAGDAPPGAASVRSGEWLGNLLAFGASLAWIAYALLTARMQQWSTLRVSALTSIPAFAVVLVAWIVANALGAVHVDGQALPSAAWRLAYVCLLGLVVGMFLWNGALQRIGAVDAMLLANLMPVVTFAIRALEGARFAAGELAGAALVVAALVANSLWMRRRAANG